MKRSITLLVMLLLCLTSSTALAFGRCPSTHGGGYRGSQGMRSGYAAQTRQVYRIPRSVAASPGAAPVVRQPAATPLATTQPDKVQARTTVEQINEALEAFRLGNNHQARVTVDRLVEQLPNHSDLLQFRSLIHLRSGEWAKSAVDMYEAVKHGAVWNSEQVEGVYGDTDRYRNDLQVLRLLVENRPDDLATQFLSAYHHLVAGELDAGRKSLQRVLAIKPDEPIAVALVRQIGTRPSESQVTQAN